MPNPEQPEKMEMNIEELAEQYKAVFSQLAKISGDILYSGESPTEAKPNVEEFLKMVLPSLSHNDFALIKELMEKMDESAG